MAATESYPYQLQNLFKKNFPHKKIEVLNFGMPGDGFQEQFFIWEQYAQEYNLDYILLGPKFYPERDLNFNSRLGRFGDFGYPKERFILLKNNKIKRVHIKGNTLKERHKRYYKMIPSKEAFSYDRYPFRMVEFLIPFLRGKISNSSYYTKLTIDDEASKINRILLKRIKDRYDKKIIFIVNEEGHFNIYRDVQHLYNLNLINFQRPSMYFMDGHGSSLDNELIANIFFNGLLGRNNFSFPIIKCVFKDREHITEKFENDFRDVKSIEIIGKDKELYSLKRNKYHSYGKGDYIYHKEDWMKSFLSFSSRIHLSPYLKPPILPLSFNLKEGMKIFLKTKSDNTIELGLVKSLDTYEKFFVSMFFSKNDNIIVKDEYNKHEVFFDMSDLSFPHLDTKEPMDLFVGEHKLGYLQLNSNSGLFKFWPLNDAYEKSFIMFGPSSNHTRISNFPLEFSLYMRYKMNDGQIFKGLISDIMCKKEKRLIHLYLPHFEPMRFK